MPAPRYYPLEIDLREQPVLMVGGGPVAARKLPELLACGARVTLVAPELCAAASRLAPGLTWEKRTFDAADVRGHKLVFACTDSPEANGAVAAACAAADIPCNRADKAKDGTFIVPGVIRRAGVTVSVSTSGQAPALTRHLKRKLSSVLGEEWGELAAILAEARTHSTDASPDSLPFETLAQAVRDGGPDAARAMVEASAGTTHASSVPGNAIHPVLLIGAGPGDPSLLTIGAAEALRSAEVVLYDRLASQAVLELVPENCERVPVEKRGHFESERQERINAMLVEYARAGKRVARLKGGDPFVFGRGYEEALALEAADLPWRVLPGVSSSIAAPALAGIPLTHRGVARSFAVASGVAGHAVNESFPKADTLVLLMALFRFEEILPRLLKAGYSPETPAAVIQDGSLPSQRALRATLGTLREEAAKAGIDSPALIVVGDVVNLGARDR
ncbi:MAG TPA: uroporphyrinogen-III C-methyltransferase [Fibrobacteria bacterium]|nr:uroporphyrinogen-III C-methyltransferase [Fibrobacteria bacterium]